jgi:phosphoribosyl 1,2-cyclic phosphodiesterase/CheY-like chemotaxis protein
MKTVLIIDDDSAYRKVTSELLRHHGWETLLADEGDEGIRLAKAHLPQIILCDLLMPRCNGFQVCRSLRADENLRNSRIVVTSGRDFASDRQAAFAAGADEYLTKPVSSPQLVKLLSSLIGSATAPEQEPATASIDSLATQTHLKFWGVRGSIPTPGPGTVFYGGNTSCVEIRAEGQIIILDAGTGLRLLGRQLMAEFDDRALDLTLLLTHTHWDHIQGLPFFLPVYKPRNHLLILGYEGARHGLDNVLTSQMESPFFPIGLREVPANVRIEELKELNFNIGSVRVQACFANHPGICVGYRLFTAAGSIAFFPDNEPYHGQSRPPSSPADEAAQEFARSQQDKLVDFLRGTDVLIMDSQYDREEYQGHIGWGHGCLDDVVGLALQASVKRLYLFHHDPNHDDAKIDTMVAHARELVAARQGNLTVEAAREGATLELPARVPSPSPTVVPA